MSGELKLRLTSEFDFETRTYSAGLAIGEDRMIILDRDLSLRCARKLTMNVVAAEYDALVVRQMRNLKLDDDVVGQVIRALHVKHVARFGEPALSDLILAPAISTAGVPAVRIKYQDYEGYLNLDQARRLSLDLVEAVEMANLDSVYFDFLRQQGVGSQTSAFMVHDLSHHRKSRLKEASEFT